MTDAIHPAPTEFTDAQLATDPILRYFHYLHLPPVLQAASGPFCRLAGFIVGNLPRNAERTVALRKLLEAKDAAVRANIPTPDNTAAQLGGIARGPESRSTARQSDKPAEEIDDGIKMTGGDQSEEPIPFK